MARKFGGHQAVGMRPSVTHLSRQVQLSPKGTEAVAQGVDDFRDLFRRGNHRRTNHEVFTLDAVASAPLVDDQAAFVGQFNQPDIGAHFSRQRLHGFPVLHQFEGQ